jgi:hypothetical protein
MRCKIDSENIAQVNKTILNNKSLFFDLNPKQNRYIHAKIMNEAPIKPNLYKVVIY